MPRIAISAVTTLASDQSGTARADRLLQPARRSCAWRIASIISSNTMRCSRCSSFWLASQLICALVQVSCPDRAAQPQQQRRDLLALRLQIHHRGLARPRQIAHRLVPSVRNPDRGELVGAQQPRQAQRIAPVGLHLVARPLRDQRRRHHDAFVAEALDLPVQPVTGRPGLVAERQPLVLAASLRTSFAVAAAVFSISPRNRTSPSRRPPQSQPHCATSTYRNPRKLRYNRP